MELTEVETAQMNNRQAQLKETVGVMSQEIGTIKQLLEKLLVPRAPATTRGDTTVEERRTEQQATKTTMHDKAASGHHMNSPQVPQS